MRIDDEQPVLNEGTFLAAVSGGADSVAMLRMMVEAEREVTAAHYNHGLRDSADGDEAFVKSLCEKWGVPFVSERGAVPKGAGLENAAREMRYGFLERARAERGLDWIATAHTADDNAETVLLNLTRGSGLHGLCGIPPQRGRIVRPLLRLSREEVIRYLTERDISWREDESNADTVYRRNYIRHTVVPALKGVNPSLTDAVARLTASLTEDEEYLQSMALEEVRQVDGGFPAKRLVSLPKPIASRVCRLLVAPFSPYPPERVHIKAMLDIAAGGNGRRRHLAGKLTVEKRNGNIHILFTNEEGAVDHAPGLGQNPIDRGANYNART
ncbi:MAG: tRNA lysidine(34) synthetase TilS [Oscillospiraceae bacterium]|jgi:tRNA(Ile)-lysidine synthase|nr:tRNA lysidine(34) synthetase TilS [Oscillospiraceae bacterium]